jgi:mono/diheme cytochrome c family protein
MKPSRVVPALLLLPLLGALFGGWAVVTVDELPDYVVAKQPVKLSFMVRQHGVRPMEGVHPTLEAQEGNRTVRGTVEPGKLTGRYVASFTLPASGDWTITINSGWGISKLTLLPLRAIEAGAAAPPALVANERGRRLFVAKGCVGCHMRMEDDITVGESFGPPLTGKRYPPDFLRRFLADPAGNATRSGNFRMPNLGLKPAEIAALVSFLNGERVALH